MENARSTLQKKQVQSLSPTHQPLFGRRQRLCDLLIVLLQEELSAMKAMSFASVAVSVVAHVAHLT
jgi:hypothetical protein